MLPSSGIGLEVLTTLFVMLSYRSSWTRSWLADVSQGNAAKKRKGHWHVYLVSHNVVRMFGLCACVLVRHLLRPLHSGLAAWLGLRFLTKWQNYDCTSSREERVFQLHLFLSVIGWILCLIALLGGIVDIVIYWNATLKLSAKEKGNFALSFSPIYGCYCEPISCVLLSCPRLTVY